MKMTMTKRLVPMLVLAALAAGTALAQADGDAPLRVPVDADGVQQVAIVGGSYFFRPNHVIVRAHVPVELTVSAGRFRCRTVSKSMRRRPASRCAPNSARRRRRFGSRRRSRAGSPTIARIGCCFQEPSRARDGRRARCRGGAVIAALLAASLIGASMTADP